MKDRYYVKQSGGDYGEWEVIDRQTEAPVVPYAWLSKQAARKEAQSLNEK